MVEQRKAVSICTDSATFELDLSTVKKIFCNDAVKNMPVALWSIVGSTRSGKSSLLNLLVQLLSEQEDSGSIISDDQTLPDVFSWKGGSNPDTRGIFVLNKPFKIETEKFGEVALFLMDVEGSGDTGQTDGTVHAQLLALTCLVSSVVNYNCKKQLHTTELESIATSALHSKHDSDGNEKLQIKALQSTSESKSCKKLQKLLFLVRDVRGFNQETAIDLGKELKRKAFNRGSSSRESRILATDTIESLFETIDCVPLPRPDNLTKHDGTNTTCSKQDFGKELMNEIRKLLAKFLSSSNIVPRQISNQSINGIEMYALFEAIESCNENSKNFAQSGYNTFCDKKMQILLRKCHDKYEKQMDKKEKNLENVNELHQQLATEIMDVFEKGKLTDCSNTYQESLRKYLAEKLSEHQLKAANDDIYGFVAKWNEDIKKDIKFSSEEIQERYKSVTKEFTTKLRASIEDDLTFEKACNNFAKELETVCKKNLKRVKTNEKTIKISLGVAGSAAAGALLAFPPIAAVVAAAAADTIAVEAAIGGVAAGLAAGGVGLGGGVAATLQRFNQPAEDPSLYDDEEVESGASQASVTERSITDRVNAILTKLNLKTSSDRSEDVPTDFDERVEISDKTGLLMSPD